MNLTQFIILLKMIEKSKVIDPNEHLVKTLSNPNKKQDNKDTPILEFQQSGYFSLSDMIDECSSLEKENSLIEIRVLGFKSPNHSLNENDILSYLDLGFNYEELLFATLSNLTKDLFNEKDVLKNKKLIQYIELVKKHTDFKS